MTEPMSRICSFGLFLGALVFAPLAFGSVENWSLLILEAGIALSFLLLSVPLLKKRAPLYVVPGALPLLLLLGLFLLQLLPLPAGVVRVLAPATFEIHRPLLVLDPARTFITLSLNPKATLLSLLTCASYSLFYMLAVNHLSRSDRLVKTATVTALLGSVIAVTAILQRLTSPDLIYWFRDAPANAYPVGPWVYSNHFAGFMEMVFPLTVALFLYYRPQVHYEAGVKEKVAAMFTMPGANRHLLLATGAVLMALSILLSLSRAGIITLCLAFLFFVYFTSRLQQNRRVHWAVCITVAVVLLLTWFGWQPIIDEFGGFWGPDGLNTSGRLPLYRDTQDIIRTFPLFGTGAGTFVHVYPAYRTIAGTSIFDHAHGDYLEVLSEIGILGFLFSAWFVLAVFIHVMAKLFRRRDRYAILLTAGALTGMLALLFHSLVDFQIYNGANGLYFFFLCGLAVSGVNTRHRFRSHPTLLRTSDSRQLILVPSAIALLVLSGTSFSRIGARLAAKTYAPVNRVYVNPNLPRHRLHELHETTTRASRYDPLEPFYLSRLGNLSTLLNNRPGARREYLDASRLNPLSGMYLQQLGLSLPDDMPAAKNKLLALGIEREPLQLDRYLIYSDWLLHGNRQGEAFAVLRKAAKNIPAAAPDIALYITVRAFNRADIELALPPLPYAWYELGRVYENRGETEAAISSYLKGLDYLHSEDTRPEYFTRIYHLYRRQGMEQQALTILRQGVELLPESALLRIELGNHYLRKNIIYRAVEEYRTALKIAPANKMLAKKIRDLEQR